MLEELKNLTFANEAEEAAWWEAHEEELTLEFEKAVAEGSINLESTDLSFVSVDLDPEDIAKARVQAAERGLRYQTYLKMIIHEALTKVEERKAKKQRSA